MAEITAATVRDLREKSGAGMMDCKKALTETNGDMEAALDWLRKKGLSAAAKKSGRVAAEGLVAFAIGKGEGTLVEVNAETDFVARNEQFQLMVEEIAKAALGKKGDVAAISSAQLASGRSVTDEITHAVATIGENMTLRRAASLSVAQGIVAGYMHSALKPGLGKIGVLVALESTGDAAKLETLGRQLAMHIAAANPQSLDVESLDPTAVERERAVLAEQAGGSGKPADIVAKMVEGRLRKFYQDVVFLEQTFVLDGETPVKKAVENVAKEIGAPIKVTGFVRYGLGEGVDKKADDFAAEVARMAG